MLKRQPTLYPQSEGTFESYEGELVFGNPQHSQYEVRDFWWSRPTAKREPWWEKMNVTVTTWNVEQSSTTEDLSEIWKEGLIDKSTRKNIDTTTDTLPVSYTTTETPATPPAGHIFLTNISSEEQMKQKQGQSLQGALRATTHDYLLELLTASSLSFNQENAADLIVLRAGSEHSLMSHPREYDDPVPFDRDLYRQLRGDITPSLREPDPDLSRESRISSKSPNDKEVDKKDIAKGKKPLGVPGWRLQYAGRTAPVNKASVDIAVPKDKAIYPGESFPSEKYPNHKQTSISFEKLFGRSLSPSKLTAPYQTSISDTDYDEIINSGHFIPVIKPALSSKSYTNEIDDELKHFSSQDQQITTSNAEPDNFYEYMENRPAHQIHTPTGPKFNPYNLGLPLKFQHHLELGNPNAQNPKDYRGPEKNPGITEIHNTVSSPYSPTIYVPPTFADYINRPKDISPFLPEAKGFTAGPAPTVKIPGYLHSNKNEVYDLQLPDLLGEPAPPASPGHVREGAIDYTTIDQSNASVINAVPGTQTVASANTQEPAISISQGITVTSVKPEVLPVVAAVSPIFTVPNMETTLPPVATTLPPATTAETTKFTLEMAPRPFPNNLQKYDIDWSQFSLDITTTGLPHLLHGFSAPEHMDMSTPHPMVVEMRTEMVEQRIGYFTVFMRKFLDIISKKDEDALAALLKAGSSSLDRVNEYNVLIGLGRPMWPGLQLLITYMRLMPLDTLKNQAMLAHMYYTSGTIFNDDVKLQELNNRIDAVYKVSEGENLMKTLVPFEDFPGEHGEITADKVMEDIFRAILAPWFRNKNSDTMYSLLNDLNERFDVIQQRYLGGGRRSHLQNKDTNNRLKTKISDSLENKKAYNDNKKTEDESINGYTSKQTVNKLGDNRVIDNIFENEDKINKKRSFNDKIRYDTRHKGTEATNRYNHVHYGDTVKQKPSKKYQKSYRDNKKSTKITKYMHDDISSLISRKDTREKRLFVKTFKNDNADTNINNKEISKIANVYNKDKLTRGINYKGCSKNYRFILQNKETISNTYDKREKTRRNLVFTDRQKQKTNDYDVYYDDNHSKIIDKRVDMMKISQISALFKEKHDDYDTYDDSAKADRREIKGNKHDKKETNNNKNNIIETTSTNYDLSDRTAKKTNEYDSNDDGIESKTITEKGNNELSKKYDEHYDTYDDSLDRKETGHNRSKNNKKNHTTNNAIKNSVRRFKNKENLEDLNALSSFEEELKNKYHEIQLLNKLLQNGIKKKPASHIDATKIETKLKNSEKHGNRKIKLSERVLQKRFETKQNQDDTKNNAKNSKIWQNRNTTKNHGNKYILVKENIPKDFQKNSHKPVDTQNKEKFRPHLKSQYIMSGIDPSLKERFLDFNRDSVPTKKKYSLRHLDKNKNILRVESSYSDEEEVLKFNLQDNLLHGGRNFTDTLHKYKKSNPIRDISDYNDEEDTLKKNIYKTFT